jgi:predicted nuclease with TOPRIM domain
MGKITIEVDEYNALKECIDGLQKEIARLDKKIDEKDEKIESLQDSLDYIFEGTTWFERAFQWKGIEKAVKNSIKD